MSIPLGDLAVARHRIKKQKNRLLSLPAAPSSPPLLELVRDGCCGPAMGGLTKAKANFALKSDPDVGRPDARFQGTARRWGAGIRGSHDFGPG